MSPEPPRPAVPVRRVPEDPAAPARAPELNEYGGRILADIGFGEAIIDLEIRRVVA
jgi:hypothetical protein